MFVFIGFDAFVGCGDCFEYAAGLLAFEAVLVAYALVMAGVQSKVFGVVWGCCFGFCDTCSSSRISMDTSVYFPCLFESR